MCKRILYVGVDVGQEDLWVAIEGSKPYSFKHTIAGVRGLYNLVRQIDTDTTLHFCMEATGVYSLKLATSLSAYPDVQVSIVNPAQIAFFARAQLRRSKTDKIDAQVILAFAQSQNPRPWTAEPKSLRQLYELVVQADALLETQRRWVNRAHTQTYIPELPTTVSKSTSALKRHLERQIAKVERSILKLCETDPNLKIQMELLCTIPGVAERSASRLLAYGKIALTDYSARALVAHAGLAPKHRQSGTSLLAKSHLAKEGNKRLRHALYYMPALVGIVYNPLLKKYYKRLVAKGKPKMLALVACMKKLLIMIRAILIQKIPFNPDIQCLT